MWKWSRKASKIEHWRSVRAPLMVPGDLAHTTVPTDGWRQTRQCRFGRGIGPSFQSVIPAATPLAGAASRGVHKCFRGACGRWRRFKFNAALHLRDSGGWRKDAAAPPRLPPRLTALSQWNGRISKQRRFLCLPATSCNSLYIDIHMMDI